MERNNKIHKCFMNIAIEMSKLSYCNRNKVGAILVKNKRIISTGYNGTPSGFCNDCEDKDGNTNWYVLHAELNCLMFALQNGTTSIGSVLYTTVSPCKECSKSIIQAGIKRVIYKEEYRDITGLAILREAGVITIQMDY